MLTPILSLANSLCFKLCAVVGSRGYVYEIKHKIIGITQEIELDIHPTDDFDYKWVKMGVEYENRKRWLASIRNM